MDSILVCLFNIRSGTPFMSVLEVRPLKNNTYVCASIRRLTEIYLEDMLFFIDAEYTFLQFYVFIHFAELVKLEQNQSGHFNDSLNGKLYYGQVIPDYLYTTTVYIARFRSTEEITRFRSSSCVAEKNYEGKSTYNEYEALESKGRHFTYAEVVSMTNNFQKVLGKGGSGTVYHGYLDDNQVAVKMLSPSSAHGYKEFQAEVSLLLRVHHRNLTSLVGFFEEGTKMGLIYEFMANGDIEKSISGSNRNVFKWERRLQAVVEAAQGLEYLHNGCKPPIVHRDIKPSNILLNDKFQAKLADFGLSRSFPLDGESYISTVVAGTPGYLDPEYSTTNWLTEKSDVYSFGIVLLKMITGRPVIAFIEGKNTHICQWVKSLLENGDIRNIVDPSLEGDFVMNSVWKAVEIAMACTSSTSTGRPTMHQVVTELNESLAEEIARKKNLLSSEYSVGSMEMVTATSPIAR